MLSIITLRALPKYLGETLTCCTSLFPPLRMEIPSLSVEESIAPGSPEIWENSENSLVHNYWADQRESATSVRSVWPLPLQALIICSTISAAPRLWRRDCWYRSRCFSISFSCEAEHVGDNETLPKWTALPPCSYTHSLHLFIHFIYAQCALVIELFTSSRGSKWLSPANIYPQSITQISHFWMKRHQ